MNSAATTGTLAHRTGMAVAFRIVGNVMNFGVAFTASVILARLIDPSEFGVFGVTAAVAQVLVVLASFGMRQALVQRQQLTPEHGAAATWFALLLGLILATLFVTCAPVLETVLEFEGIAATALLVAVVVPLEAIAIAPLASLARGLAFGRIAAVDLVMRITRAAVGITLALAGWGAQGLALGWVAGTAARLVLAWLFSDRTTWRLRFRTRHLVELLRYARGMVSIQLTNDLTRRVDVLILAATTSSAIVGIYQRAFQLVLLPFDSLTLGASRVFFPALAAVQAESERFARGYLSLVRFATLLTFPCLAFLAVIADQLVPALYGEAWRPVVPYVRILAVAVAVRVACNTQGVVTQSTGHVGAEARCQVLFLLAMLIAVSIGSRFGGHGVAVGVACAGVVLLTVMTQVTNPIAGVSFGDWFGAIRTSLVASVSMGVSVLVARLCVTTEIPFVQFFFLEGAVAAGSYALSVRWLASRADREALAVVCERLPQPLASVLVQLLIRGGVPSAAVRVSAPG